MSLHQRNTRESHVNPGGAPPKLKVKRGADGELQVEGAAGEDAEDRKATVEAAERPATPDDPRQGPMRNVPPIGGA